MQKTPLAETEKDVEHIDAAVGVTAVVEDGKEAVGQAEGTFPDWAWSDSEALARTNCRMENEVAGMDSVGRFD